jgi:mitochondrial fission protein ELM1
MIEDNDKILASGTNHVRPASDPPRHVWILDEGSQGHLVQSRGMLRELAKAVPLEVVEVRIHCALTGRIGRSLVKKMLRLHRRKWLFRCLHPQMKLPETKPDLIVSSGPHSLAALEFLAYHHKCPSVFVQGTIAVPEGAVTAVMRPFEGERREDYIFIPLLFTEITVESVREAGEVCLKQNAVRPQGPINALFIGNSSAKIRFSQEDWDGIIRFVNAVWQSDGTQWLITTSYRTGSQLEDRFRRGINPDAILEAVWYSEAPRKVTKEYLGMADRVFVTMDSLTMLTEAIASGRPTCALCPAEQHEDPSNTHLRYVRDLAANGLITRIEARNAAVSPSMPPTTSGIDYSGPIRQLMARIQWNP